MADEPSKRPRGRPRVAPHSSVSVWLTTAEHDRLITLANRQEVSVSTLVRLVLEEQLRGP